MNIKELVESFVQVRHGIHQECILKSDFDRVVEELTKWNKVEDKNPQDGEFVLCKRRSGLKSVCVYRSGEYLDSLAGLALEIVEWRYIY
jgi:hypothetical protein